MREETRESTIVLDIRRGSQHDGPGLRTTIFLKGCALQCAWCHNPESQSFLPQLMFNREKCTGCGRCVSVCEHAVHQKAPREHTVSFRNCRGCGRCEEVCPNEAITIQGHAYTVDEVFDIAKKDSIFYKNSGGGVTLSGGEPLLHEPFCREFLERCREEEIHSCVETSAHVPPAQFRRLMDLPDLMLIDYKLTERTVAKKWIGAELDIIDQNLSAVFRQKKKMILRCPIIPGVNDNRIHFDRITRLVLDNPCIIRVELLPYHNFGVVKGKNIGMNSNQAFPVPGEEQKNQWLSLLKKELGEKVVWG